MSEAAVTAEDLAFTWPPDAGGSAFTLALPGWQVRRGSRVALHGRSGCGKSTLMGLVAGILRPQAGRLTVEGLELAGAPEAARRAHRIRHMGLVFQGSPLVDHLDAVENVLLPYRVSEALRLDGAARRRAEDLLGELGLAHRRAHRPAALSQGERQRVAIARALVTEPRLLLADEPTTGLDPERSIQVMDLLSELTTSRGLTLIMVTHDPMLLPSFDEVLEVGPLSREVRP